MNKIENVKALLVMVTGFLVLYFIFDADWLLYIATGVGVVSLVIPIAGEYITKGWFKLAEGLGWINSKILLSIIFFVFLFPFALIARLFGKSDLKLRRQEASQSVFENRNHKYTADDLENIW